jgi:hypothetical protein
VQGDPPVRHRVDIKAPTQPQRHRHVGRIDPRSGALATWLHTYNHHRGHTALGG